MEKIIETSASKQFQNDYTRYGVYVMYARVIPDYRDGLKPVHRRILWAAYNDVKAITATTKSATLVGAVMGNYAPTGDSGIYGSFRPMLNWFECKQPLLEGQGFFGNFQGDEESAYRYTECKLSKFAYDYVIGDLRETKECVDWTPNYKNSDLEPQFLPCAVPLLLINGAFGIGVGKKPEIPTHNLAEVIDATLALIEDPNQEITLIPDHCMPCEIVNTDWDAISRMGYGYYTVRGICNIEEYSKNHYKNRTALVIKSVPNLTFLNTITDKIEEMIENKKIIQIENMFDESSKSDMRFVIILKQGSDAEYVRNMIYQNTLLEQNCRINFEALNGLNPVRFNYKSYLLSFIDQRKLTKFRVYTNKLQTVQTKLHEREAYIKALESGKIDEIIKKIRARKTNGDDASLIEYLVKNIGVTTLQAQYIINIPLKKLSIYNLKGFKEDAAKLEILRKQYLDIILDEKKLLQIIIDELKEIKAKYGVPRVCKIIKSINTNEVPKGAMSIVITEKNFIKKVPFGTSIGNPRNDTIKMIVNADNADNILIFDNMGKVFKLAVHKIQFADKASSGVDIRFLIKGLTANIATIIPEKFFLDSTDQMKNNSPVKHYILTISKAGFIKRMDLEDFAVIPSSGLIYAKVEQGDFIQSVRAPFQGMNVLVFSERKAMNIPLESIPVMKRNARGNRTFRSSLIDGITLLPPKESLQYNNVSLVVITENGRFNKLPISGIPNLDTIKKEFNVIKIGKNDRIIDIHVVDESSIIIVKTIANQYTIQVNTLIPSSSISTGDRLVSTSKDKIVKTYVQ